MTANLYSFMVTILLLSELPKSQFCWHVNKGDYLGFLVQQEKNWLKLLTLAITQRFFGPEENWLTVKPQKFSKWPWNCSMWKFCWLDKILAGPKTPPQNCNGLQFCEQGLQNCIRHFLKVTMKLQRLAVTWGLFKTGVYGCFPQIITDR